jgi:hypothetical protein
MKLVLQLQQLQQHYENFYSPSQLSTSNEEKSLSFVEKKLLV